jgi:hypothetical protein
MLYRGLYLQLHAPALRKFGTFIGLRKVFSYTIMILTMVNYIYGCMFPRLNPLKAELNPICHLLALLGAHHILHVRRIRINPF